MAEAVAVALGTATADATAGKFLVRLSTKIGEQQVGLLPYFFARPSAQSRVPFNLGFGLA
jgi:hypothetical protein